MTDVGSSKTIKNLVAKIKDYADESGLSDSRYAEVKQMYLRALEQIADALKRLVEVDPKLGDMAIDNFQELSNKLVKSLEEIATSYASKMNDSIEFEGDFLNESIFRFFKAQKNSSSYCCVFTKKQYRTAWYFFYAMTIFTQ